MKSFFSKKVKCSVLVITIAVIVLIALIIILAVRGFKITYSPELENSWDAVSACAGWAGALLSAIAVIVAINIPKKIADRQDKIALFEKRMECYTVIQNFIACAYQLEDLKTKKDVQTAFRVWMPLENKLSDNMLVTDFALKIKQQEKILVSGRFLFTKYDEQILQEILNFSVDLILAVPLNKNEKPTTILSEDTLKLKKQFCDLCFQFENKYISSLEKEIDIN